MPRQNKAAADSANQCKIGRCNEKACMKRFPEGQICAARGFFPVAITGILMPLVMLSSSPSVCP
jgi:hypothetical protein